MVTHVSIMKRIDKKLKNMDEREERLIKAIEDTGYQAALISREKT